MPLINHHSH
ncbi:hypothetical protein RDI58_018657 [Solanum bulbocastanum]|uniref:Uncharacterized protein n=1 Tax=Solanum bulbocastanum TaxID=147425 RepID=A0AAN8YAD3_SOLBU